MRVTFPLLSSFRHYCRNDAIDGVVAHSVGKRVCLAILLAVTVATTVTSEELVRPHRFKANGGVGLRLVQCRASISSSDNANAHLVRHRVEGTGLADFNKQGDLANFPFPRGFVTDVTNDIHPETVTQQRCSNVSGRAASTGRGGDGGHSGFSGFTLWFNEMAREHLTCPDRNSVGCLT